MNKKSAGFTTIEMIVAFGVLAVLAVFFVTQRNDLDFRQRDQDAKVAINAIYYSLQEVYFPEHGSYPSEITPETLRGIDPSLLTDPFGNFIGSANSLYGYEATGCQGTTACTGFKLTADLLKEEDYIKSNK